MAKLYYGSGYCTLESSDANGVEIRYRGDIEITKTCGDGCLLAVQNNGIIVLSLDGNSLSDLFTYKGELRIKSVLVADSHGEKVPCIIKKSMDIPENMQSTPESMTEIPVNKMTAGYVSGGKVKTSKAYNNMLNNQHSNGELYLKDGTSYRGAYHVHIDAGKAMTGAVHSKSSKDLYIKNIRTGKMRIN